MAVPLSTRARASMKDSSNNPNYLNPREVIKSGLPTLYIAPVGETVEASSLAPDRFIGALTSWKSFEEDVTKFWRDEDLISALDCCDGVNTDLDVVSLKQINQNHAMLELTQIGDERDLNGRFLNNVLNRVISATRTILDKRHVSKAELGTLRARLSLVSDFNAGSAKIVPKIRRQQHEPDVILKIPGSGSDQQVRMVGELKFPRTCAMNSDWGNTAAKGKGSMRHVFGQIARDMREVGARFGFLSTYQYTVFLRVILLRGGDYGLQYSDRIPHEQSVVDDLPNGSVLSSISVRLATMYLLYRASQKDDSWSFDKTKIHANRWTNEGAGGHLEEEVPTTPYLSPFNLAQKKTSKFVRLRRPLGATLPERAPVTPANNGPSPDDPRDGNYMPSGTPSRMHPRDRVIMTSTSSGSDEDGQINGDAVIIRRGPTRAARRNRTDDITGPLK